MGLGKCFLKHKIRGTPVTLGGGKKEIIQEKATH